jgi:cobalamin synthase
MPAACAQRNQVMKLLLPLADSSGMAMDLALGFRHSVPIWGALLLGIHGVLSILTELGAAALVLWLAKLCIGGVTGDVFGMLVVLLVFVAD